MFRKKSKLSIQTVVYVRSNIILSQFHIYRLSAPLPQIRSIRTLEHGTNQMNQMARACRTNK